MRSFDALPDHTLSPSGPCSCELLERRLADYRSAASHLHALPYGRNADRSDYRLVLEEGRGTCSTKHALLAAVALEQGVEVELIVGIYDMNEANTPGVGAVLAAHALASLPEAHCYLRYRGERIDVTRSGVAAESGIEPFESEWIISPDQIGEYKQQLHRDTLHAWYARQAEALAGVSSFEELWKIREACIAALAQ